MQWSSSNRATRRLVVGAALVAVGCGVPPKDINLGDKGVFFPSLRITTAEPLSLASKETPADPESMRKPERTFSIELDLSGGSGDDSQSLQSGESIRFEGTTFSGPGTVDGEFDLVAGSLALRVDMPRSESARAAFLVGLGFTELDLELSQNGTKERDTSSALGLMLGVLAEIQFSSRTSFQGRFTLMLGKTGGDEDDGVVLTQLEAGLLWAIAGGVSVFGGFRHWSYEQNRTGSDVDIEMSGPVLGVQIGF